MNVAAAGVDTWSPAWSVKPDSRVARALSEKARVPIARGWALPDLVAGHTLCFLPHDNLVYAEGHPSLDDRQLGSGDDLPALLEHIETEMFDRGMPLPLGNARKTWGHVDDVHRDPGFAGVRRLDATVDLLFETPAEGLTFLTGLAAVSREAPYIQAKVTFAPGGAGVQTVELKGRGGRKTLGRAYDKGVEQRGADPAGTWVRLEDQRRFPGDKRPPVEALGTAEVKEYWRKRFSPFLAASEGVRVTTLEAAAEDLMWRVNAGLLDYGKAEDLCGHLLLGRVAAAHGIEGSSRATWYRRRREIREMGIVIADGIFDCVELDLHGAIEQALYAEAWDRRGCPVNQLQLDGFAPVEQAPAVEDPSTVLLGSCPRVPAGPAFWISDN